MISNFSTNKRVFLRYGYLYNVAGSPNYFRNLADEGYGPMTVRAHNGVLGYTQTIGASTVLELRAAVNRFSAFRPSNGLGFKITSLGMPANLQTFLEQGDVDEFPGLAVQGYSTLGNNNGPYYASHELDYIFNGNLSRVIGKHTVTIGAEQRDYYLNFLQTNPMVMNFGADLTQGPNPRAVTANSGDALASMLLGAMDSGSVTFYAHPSNANHYWGQFIQDDIKWTRKLTMNIGFRKEEETTKTERSNRMAAINPYVLNPISSQVTNPFTGTSPWNLYGGYVFPGNGPDSLGRSSIAPIQIKPNPRFGIAYSLDDKTVIRSGYGIFFGVSYDAATREFNSNAFQTTTPFVTTVGGNGIQPAALFSNPLPSGGLLYPPGASQGLLTLVGTNLNTAYPPTLKTPYNQQWNFSIQRSLTTDMLLQVAYVGNKGTHLPWSGGGGSASLNQLQPQYSSVGNQLISSVPNPFYGNPNVATGLLAQPTVVYGQLLRPYPEWQTVAMDGEAIGDSEYNALQISFTKRYTNGLSIIGAYTWSKLMSDIADGVWNAATANENGAIRSYYCIRCEHSISSYDVPSRFTAAFVYELPFGKGRKFGKNWNRLVDSALGGWQTNGIATLASGQPLVFLTASTVSGLAGPFNNYTFGGGQHPNVVANPVLSSGKTINNWFNTAAFTLPPNFSSGDLSRTYAGVRAPRLENLDFSLFKSFPVTERFKLELRAEAFNVTNTPVFAAPGTTVGGLGSGTNGTTLNGANFGAITSQSNGARTVQLALKLLF